MIGRVVFWLRRLVATVVLLAMAGLFVFPAAACLREFSWLPGIQLLPALAACSLVALVAIAVSVALCGRLYCSLVCPLGILQAAFREVFTLDLFRKTAKRSLPRASRLSSRTLWTIRGTILLAFVASACFCGLFAWLAPYGTFGRSALAFTRDCAMTPIVRIVALVQLAFILLATLGRGRFWCNLVCPVGTLLGLFSRFAVFRVRIDAKKCVNCNLCARACPNGCIPADREKKVDHSRCVSCFACAGVCGKGALTWR